MFWKMRVFKENGVKSCNEKFNNIHNFSIDLDKINRINNMVVKEYINEYNGVI